MTAEQMWQMVDTARATADDPADAEQVAEALVTLLAQQEPPVISGINLALRQVSATAYSWPLWGAAYVMNGGCSDDGFDYFLGWLVAQGWPVFDRALTDPDSLAAVVSADDEGEFDGEDLLSVAWDAYEQATGDELPAGPTVQRPELGPGWDFDDDAEMRRRYAQLTGKFFD